MPRYRIALQIGLADPYWVQVREAIVRHAHQQRIELVSLSIDATHLLNPAQADEIFEELQVQQVQALICNSVAEDLVRKVTAQQMPVIDASESFITCPLFTSRRGLYDAAYDVGLWLNNRLPPNAHVLIVGGYDEMGMSRLQGIADALQITNTHISHVPCTWFYDDAYTQVVRWLSMWPGVIHAVFGLSDSLALAGCDALAHQQRLGLQTFITGINGDPLALANISRGRMHMTVETVVDSFAAQMIELAVIGIQTRQLFDTYDPPRRIIDRTNVDQVALDKLISLAELPNQLVGVSRQREQQRMRQLETSLAITQRVGGILDHQQLFHEFSDLIKTIYGYHRVMLWRYNSDGELVGLHTPSTSLRAGSPLAMALHTQAPVFIPDALASQRFARDDEYTTTRTRVVLPIRVNTQIVGLMDLQSDDAIPHSRGEIDGLQLVADQIGIALQNIDLYQAAKQAQYAAEQADSLKTRLLANVSHELRTPLHIILGYSQLLVTEPLPHGIDIGDEIRSDLRTIQRSAEHLIHLINDLLDVSRAEINELVLYPEMTNIHHLLTNLFGELHQTFYRDTVVWRCELPADLPLMYVDANRVRQIMTNIVGNAAKFTSHGEIVLGAQVEPPYLHMLVKDSGVGIARSQQEHIFEPFVTLEHAQMRRGGVGLGLAITRRLVALHRGILTVESIEGQGSTFHCYLPLRGLATDQPALPVVDHHQCILVLGVMPDTPIFQSLADALNLPLSVAHSIADIESLVQQIHPAFIVWDTATTLADEFMVLNWLQSHPQLGHIPFLVYDTYHTHEPTPILQKPVQNRQFVEMIRMIAAQHQMQQPQLLIIDDDASMHTMYRELLVQQTPAVTIQSCMNGDEAHQLLSNGYVPSLIVLDLVMPEYDGFALLSWMRAQPQLAHVPVLVISGKVLTRTEIQQLQYPNTMVRPKLGSDPANLQSALMQLLVNPHTNPPHLGTAARQAMAFIQQSYMKRISREQIAHAAGVSESYLTQVFQNELGMTPWVYLTRFRVAQACVSLRNTDDTVTDIAVSVGFDDPGYFSKVFRNETGMTPREYRQQLTNI